MTSTKVLPKPDVLTEDVHDGETHLHPDAVLLGHVHEGKKTLLRENHRETN